MASNDADSESRSATLVVNSKKEKGYLALGYIKRRPRIEKEKGDNLTYAEIQIRAAGERGLSLEEEGKGGLVTGRASPSP